MSKFSYKRTETTTTMKVSGIIDVDRMVIDVDGEEKDIRTLLSVFNGGNIELNIKIKTDEDLDEPVALDDEEE